MRSSALRMACPYASMARKLAQHRGTIQYRSFVAMRHDMWKTVAALGTWSLIPRSFVATFGTLSRRGTERCRAGHGTWSLILRSFVAHTNNSTSNDSIACCDKV